MPSQAALDLVREQDRKHPPKPMPEHLERELLALWGDYKPPADKIIKARK